MSAEPLVVRTRPAAGEPEGVLVLLHGRGSDELDLEPLADELDPERRFSALLPRGPLALPPAGAHWYAVREVGFPDPETFLADVRAPHGLGRRRAGRDRACRPESSSSQGSRRAR